MNVDMESTLSNVWILLPISVAVLSVSLSFLFPKKKALLPAGLVNLGNTCFANSVLQALASCPVLIEYLRNSDAELDLIILELIEGLNEISASPVINPKLVLNALSMTSGRKGLLGYQQQDAHEFLISLTNQLSEEIMQDDILHMLNSDGLQGVFLGRKINFAKAPLKSPIKGYLAMRLCCQTCGYKTPIAHEPFDNLSLTVDKRHYTNLKELLLNSVATEVIDDWCCDKCTLIRTIKNIEDQKKAVSNSIIELKKKKRKAQHAQPKDDANPEAKKDKIASEKRLSVKLDDLKTQFSDLEKDLTMVNDILRTDLESPLPTHIKKLKTGSPTLKRTLISRPPRILTIHMQRSMFDYTGNVFKNNCRVDFPEYLDIREFCTCTDGVYFKPMEMAEASSWKESLDMKERDALAMDRSESNNHSGASYHDKSDLESEIPDKTVRESTNDYIYLYRLNAVCLHYGSHDSGHFVTYRRYPKKKSSRKSSRSDHWYAISDDHVRRINDIQGEVFGYASQFVYLLFYERVSGSYDIQIPENLNIQPKSNTYKKMD